MIVITGVALISALAQLTIPLPFTPVPITGQTFAVAVVSLLWGRKLALATILSYLSLGAFGLPIFAQAKSGLSLGPTLGFLIGMIFSSFWMGLLADRGWTKTFAKTWLAATSGSLVTFTFGLSTLSFFLPAESLFTIGFLPFIPGDIIKTLLASTLVYQCHRWHKENI